MNVSERQQALFDAALNKVRCPKCKGKVLSTVMPDAICEKCGTQYVLATRMGHGLLGGGLHAQLIEKNQPAQVPIPVAQSQAVAVPQGAVGKFCHNCGSQAGETSKFCNKCGTQLA